MSNYDDALSLIENEVNKDCEYYVYSQLRDCIDTIEDDCKLLESENAKLRELVQYICDECYGDEWFVEKAAALGIEGHY